MSQRVASLLCVPPWPCTLIWVTHPCVTASGAELLLAAPHCLQALSIKLQQMIGVLVWF